MKHLRCIAGPTASGKTSLSIAMAKELGGEIVSCDSMQVYKRMDIGTAKPTIEERENIPHHMLDVAEPWEDFSVSKYCEMASPIVDDIMARGKTAIVVGGTGLYMDSLIKGNDFAPYPATGRREELEKLAADQGIEAVIAQLREVDPESAARLHPSDQKRIIRALGIISKGELSLLKSVANGRKNIVITLGIAVNHDSLSLFLCLLRPPARKQKPQFYQQRPPRKNRGGDNSYDEGKQHTPGAGIDV